MKKQLSREAKIFRRFIGWIYLALFLGLYRIMLAKSKGADWRVVFFPSEIKFLDWAFYDSQIEEQRDNAKVYSNRD